MIDDIYRLKNELHKKGIFFCFSGPISHELLAEIGETLKQKMKLEDANNTTVLRVFSLFVEKVQNIIHYSAEKISKPESNEPRDLKLGIIAVGFEDGHYFIQCGNMIENHKVDSFKQKLLKIQNMSKEELKKYYKEQRRKEAEEGSKGAGLGLIEVAKKAEYPIEFQFQPINESYSFFSSKAII